MDEVQPMEPSLRAYLRKSVSTEWDAEDLLQESYARLFKARQRGEVRSTRPFLFTIARNAVRNFIRRRSSDEVVPIQDEGQGLPLLEDEDLVESLCRSQERTLLVAAIQDLPERCREVILLRKIEGCSQKEIAALLGIAENTVESLASRGVRRCAEYLRRHGVGPSRRKEADT